MTRYHCATDSRRALIAAHPTLNGIDFVDVLDGADVPDDQRQQSLFVHFVKPLAITLDPAHVRITGGQRIRGIKVTGVVVAEDDPSVVRVDVDRAGDFSVYTLRLVADPDDPAGTEPPDGIDPVLAAVDVQFKADCPTEIDCAPADCPPEDDGPPPPISYLAKDYASFRTLLLDRMSTLAPQWQETHPADAGIALVEVLAYVGDQLSYAQDAIATEAYLGTARSRVSVRRHARLVDYAMHDGRNARAWVQVQVDADIVPAAADAYALDATTSFLTRVDELPTVVEDGPPLRAALLRGAAEVFEVADSVHALYQAHNAMDFYTWAGQRCCLPKGATEATLVGALPTLKAGDVLLLSEVAEGGRVHPVRLGADGAPGTDALTGDDYTTVVWPADDALPFELCISRVAGDGTDEAAARALGNVVLVDHGATVGRLLPSPKESLPEAQGAGGRYRPTLALGPVTQAGGPVDRAAPASAVDVRAMVDVLPAARLYETGGREWSPMRDLLRSDPSAPNFVVEVDDAGTAHVRFGGGLLGGDSPPAGEQLEARYRVGNGRAGNVGRGAIAHIAGAPAGTKTAVVAVTNPLPAHGGLEPETSDEVRQRAPSAYRTQRRAVTAEDYAERASRCPGVQKAVATLRWTGSWHTVFLTVDRLGGHDLDAAFEAKVRAFVEPYRMAGHDLEVDGPVYVPLDVAFTICVAGGYRQADVRAAVLDLVLAAFRPDELTFGQSVYLSPLVAAAQRVTGVSSVTVDAFQRWGDPASDARDVGRLDLGRLEIAQLANDPNFEDRGVLRLTMEGGR